MKLLLAVALLVMTILPPVLSADQSGGYYAAPQPDSVGSAESPLAATPDVLGAKSKKNYSDLERRIYELERENRFQEDRIRDLDRMIDDLKRRNYR